VSRGKIKALIVTALLGVIAFYFWHDLNLPYDTILRHLPDIVVENLDFRRTIGSRDVRLLARAAERESGVIRATDITINVFEFDTGREMSVRAALGEFPEESTMIEIRSMDGSIYIGDRSVDISAPAATYERSDDTWSFREGVEFHDDDIFISGGDAAITSEGIISLEKGARVRWTYE
jgi:hypothetical protein